MCQAPLLLVHSTQNVSDSMEATEKLVPGLRYATSTIDTFFYGIHAALERQCVLAACVAKR